MIAAIIANFPVGPKYNGGAMTVWGIVQALKKKKYKIDLILLLDKKTSKNIVKDCLKFLKANRINYKIIEYNNNKIGKIKKFINLIKSVIFKTPDYFFPNQVNLKEKVKKILNSKKFHYIVCYHFDALSACYELKNKSIVCCMGDLMHDPRNKRRLIKKNNFFLRTINKFEEILSIRVSINMLKNFKNIGFYAYHYSKFMRKYIKRVKYYRTSIVAPKKFFNYSLNKKVDTIVLVGDLTGTVTISSLKFLNKFLNFTNYEVKNYFKFNIIGGGSLDKSIINFDNFKFVKFKGISENITKEFTQSTILLACNTIDVGIRVRIITALSHGIVVVTHSSNCKGIPELVNKKNSLIFNSKNELQKILIEIKNSKLDLSFLSKNAIDTFNKFFYYERALIDLEKKLI